VERNIEEKDQIKYTIPVIRNGLTPSNSEEVPRNTARPLVSSQGGSEVNKTRDLSRCTRGMLVTSRILIIGNSHVRGCSEKLMNSLGKAYRVIGITKPNANISAILNSMNLKDDKLSMRDVVIFCGGSRDIAKKESTQGLRMISNC
jgi:hypothetical protein